MALVLKGKPSSSSSGNAQPLPKVGARPARLSKVYDIGWHKCEYDGQPKPDAQMVVLEYDLVDDLYDFGDGVMRPITISSGWFFPLKVSYDKTGRKLNDKSNLYKHTTALDPSDSWGGNLKNLLLKPCIITTTLNTSGDKTYANIAKNGVSPVPDMDGFVIKDTPNPGYAFDIDDYTQEEWDALPEFIQNKIKEAINFKPLEGSDTPEAITPDDVPF